MRIPLKKQLGEEDLFDKFKNNILNIDPVAFVENNLTLDGRPFRLNGNGYKPFCDIYRYIGLKAIEKNAKPIVLVKGRQVGATTMAAALECYFMTCGIFGSHGRPPIRLAHLFPTLGMAAAFSKQKFEPMIASAKPMPGMMKKDGTLKSYIETFFDTSSPSNNNMYFKQFIGTNQVFIDSTGIDGDRLRGRSMDCVMFDECFPYDQNIEIKNGKIAIGKIYDLYINNEQLPLVKTYNESKDIFEYKRVTKAWKRGKRKLIKMVFENNSSIICTPNHKFLTDLGWQVAEEIYYGELIKTTTGFIKVNLSLLIGEDDVYDIEVEDNHNFITIIDEQNGLVAHNCQDIPELAIGAVSKILAQAQYGHLGKGIQVYFGTPKQKGTAYYNIWNMAQQNYYHLHCEKCEEYFPLYRPDVDWEKIWLYGFIVKCTNCGHEQDKRPAADRGKWVPIKNINDDEYKYIGYHINQLYIPTFPKEVIIDQKPENNPTNTERLYQNEVLGEFFDGDGGTISIEEIHEKCGDRNRKFIASIPLDSNKRAYAGYDWGQKGDFSQMLGKQRGQSYSCGVILTAEGPDLFSIDFATRLKRVDPQSKEDVVEEMFRRYNVHLAVGDIGDAFDLTHTLQKKYGDRFLASRAVPKVIGHIRLNKEIFPKEILFERDYYISELIGLLKNGNIKFPYGDYEKVRWLVSHCCSMDIKITTNRQGDPVRRYIKGPTPNDGFMALLNAYIAYKCDISQGFNIKHPRWMKKSSAREKRRIPAVLGYCPHIK